MLIIVDRKDFITEDSTILKAISDLLVQLHIGIIYLICQK